MTMSFCCPTDSSDAHRYCNGDNIIRVNLCYPWDMISHADFADFADIAMDNIIRVILCYPWDMISHADFADAADIAMGNNLCQSVLSVGHDSSRRFRRCRRYCDG